MTTPPFPLTTMWSPTKSYLSRPPSGDKSWLVCQTKRILKEMCAPQNLSVLPPYSKHFRRIMALTTIDNPKNSLNFCTYIKNDFDVDLGTRPLICDVTYLFSICYTSLTDAKRHSCRNLSLVAGIRIVMFRSILLQRFRITMLFTLPRKRWRWKIRKVFLPVLRWIVHFGVIRRQETAGSLANFFSFFYALQLKTIIVHTLVSEKNRMMITPENS